MIKNIVFDMGQVLVSYVGNLVCQIYKMCIRDRYKEGKPIESVGTDGGYIPKPKMCIRDSGQAAGQIMKFFEIKRNVIE